MDNTCTTGGEAFETIASIVQNLGRHGAGATGTQENLRPLSAGKNYFKSAYKSHLGPDQPCADHCTVFALSDPVVTTITTRHDQNARVLWMF